MTEIQIEWDKNKMEGGLWTKLHFAAYRDNLDKLRSVLKSKVLPKKSKYSIDVRDSFTQTPLMLACWFGRFENVKILVEGKADIRAATRRGITPLIFASFRGHQSIVEYLLSLLSKEEINVSTKPGNTALIAAASNKQINIVKLLIKSGADITVKNADGKTAFDVAREAGYEGICELLQGSTPGEKIKPYVNIPHGNYFLQMQEFYVEGMHNYKLKNYEEAIQNFDCALSVYKRWLDLPSDNPLKGKYLPSSQHEMIQIVKTNRNCYVQRGLIKYEKKEYESAIQDYDQAMKQDDRYAVAYEYRADAKVMLKKYTEALKDYERAISLDPKNASFYVRRGIMKQELEEYAEALADFDQAIKLNSEDANAYFNRGNLQFERKKYQEALADYTQAIKLSPVYAEIPLIQSHVKIIKQKLGEQQIEKEKIEKEKIEQRQEEEVNNREEREEKHRRAAEKRLERRKQEEKEKKKQAEESQQQDFMQTLATLKQEQESSTADMKTLNTKYKALEPQAFKLSSAEFFAQRGDLYYAGSLKATSSITKNMLWTNAIQDYKQAILFNPFYEDKAERIEEIEKQLKQSALPVATSSSFHNKEKDVSAEKSKPLKREDLTQAEKDELEEMKAQLRTRMVKQ